MTNYGFKVRAYFHHNMACQKGIIRKNDVVSNLAVMGDMARTHDKIVIPNNLITQREKMRTVMRA